jgi:hypothetical protein
VSAKYEAADAVMITKSGIKKKFGLNRVKNPIPNIYYRHRKKSRILFKVKHSIFPSEF